MVSKPAQRRLREKAVLRQAILDAARNLLIADGYASISIRAVADAIEYSPATLYLHFTDREAILAALALEGYQELADRMRTVEVPGIFDRMVGQAQQYLQFAVQNPHMYELMFLARDITLFSSNEDKVADGPECFQMLMRSVEEARAKGALRQDLPIPILAYSIWGNIHGIASLAISGRLKWLPEAGIPVLFQEGARSSLLGFQPPA